MELLRYWQCNRTSRRAKGQYRRCVAGDDLQGELRHSIPGLRSATWGTRHAWLSGVLVEEKRIGGLRGVAEVGEADADETVFLIGIEGDF